VIHRRPLAAVTLRSTAKSDSSRSLEHEDSKPVGVGLSRRLQVKLESGRIGNLSWPDNIDERAAAGCTEKIPVTVPVLCNLGGSRRVRGGFKVGISPPDFTSRLVDTSAPSPASLRLSWICRTLRQLRSAKRGKIDGPTPVYRRFGRRFSTSS